MICAVTDEGAHDRSIRGGAERSVPGAGGAPLQVLFVCTANICRSAYAEVLARHLVGPCTDIAFSSAGTHGFPSRPLNPEIAEFLPNGAVQDGFASRRVTRELVQGADAVLAAAAVHRAFLLEEDPSVFRKVFTLGQFAEAVEGSELRGRDLINAAGRHRPASRPQHDVRDPYRQGRAANAEAAARIAELLQVVLPGLAEPGRCEST